MSITLLSLDMTVQTNLRPRGTGKVAFALAQLAEGFKSIGIPLLGEIHMQQLMLPRSVFVSGLRFARFCAGGVVVVVVGANCTLSASENDPNSARWDEESLIAQTLATLNDLGSYRMVTVSEPAFEVEPLRFTSWEADFVR
jgi:hypothetical protein